MRKGREEESEEIVRKEGDAVVAYFQRYCPSIRLEEPWKTTKTMIKAADLGKRTQVSRMPGGSANHSANLAQREFVYHANLGLHC